MAQSESEKPPKTHSFASRFKDKLSNNKQSSEKPVDEESASDSASASDADSIDEAKAKKDGCRCCNISFSPAFCRWSIIVFLAIATLAVVGVIIWHFFLIALVKRLGPPAAPTHNGVNTIVDRLKGQRAMVPQEPYWVDGFTKGVNPVACHSHNDYDRDVPLYDAIAAGCTGVEADLSAVGDELFVDHSRLSSKDGDHRTIQRLYLDPIMAILKGQNSELVKRSTSWNESQAAPSWRGVFDEKPEQTLSLLCDFKSSTGTYPVLVKALQPLRDAGWLTGYNTRTKEMRWGPVTIVASGDAPFDQINVANPTGIPGYDIRDIFYDAPLRDLGDGSVYNATNSYYASSSLIMAVGPVLPTGMTQGQKDKVGAQLKAAKDLNLLGRYWGTPSWPVSNKIRSWRVFNERGAGMLNVDNLKLATQWNWDICNIMGYELC